jgi:glutamate racemase
MIEEGYGNDNISHAVIHKYLEEESIQQIDALILGCTHYVMIKEEINDFYKGSIKLFDSTDIVAQKLKMILEKEGLANDVRRNPDNFYVSDFTSSFQKSAQTFYGHNIKLEKCDIW